ncbi:MAG: plasmid pRiA4b ORF-3 family protein [Elusimicrobiota bacterium]
MSKKIFRFKIVLNGILPQIWREIEVESDITFYQFHLTVQEAMGWGNSHLHEFSLDGLRIGDTSEEACEYGEPPRWEEREKELSEYFSEYNTRIEYVYDFGDNWEHTIMLEAIEDKKKNIKYPRCIDGARACPPEDCGSSPGYYNLLEILSDPENEEYGEMREWAGDYDPEYFDKKEATEAMRDPVDLSEGLKEDFDKEIFISETDVENKQKWKDLEPDFKKKILSRVYCAKCGKAVTMVDYTVTLKKGMETLRGKCADCSNTVVRVLE